MIHRPNVHVNGRHEYFLLTDLPDGDQKKEKLQGVSTVAKVGEDEVWGMAGARGFRIGYEGAYDVLEAYGYDLSGWTKDMLRDELKKRGLTPWQKTEKAAQRGNNVHDALEQLAQKGQIAALDTFAKDERPFVQALARWFLDYRPKFEATEVQVVSSAHKFAGRYDIRATISGVILLEKEKITPVEFEAKPSGWLTLDDLKTGKGVYPTSHFPQLAGYELAGTEMGYPKTDAQFILNCKEDGTYEFARSNATAEHFLAYLAAHRATLDIKKKNPKPRKAKA